MDNIDHIDHIYADYLDAYENKFGDITHSEYAEQKINEYNMLTGSEPDILSTIRVSRIEYIHRENNCSVIHMDDGETISVSKNLVKIAEALNRSYLVKCSREYVINIKAIEYMSEDYKTFKMKSGTEIPISKAGFESFLKSFSILHTGVNVFNY